MTDTTQDPTELWVQAVKTEIAEHRRLIAMCSSIMLESLKDYEIPTSHPNAAGLAKHLVTKYRTEPNSQVTDRVYDICTNYYAGKAQQVEKEIAELEHDCVTEEFTEVAGKLEELETQKRQQQHELRKLYKKWTELRSPRAWRP